MTMIFPGMDPYLEESQLWRSVHSRLIVYIADQLQPQLSPRYVATVEERVFVEGPDRGVMPDVWVARARRGGEQPDAGGVAVLDVDEPVLVEAVAREVNESYIGILDLYPQQQLVTLIEAVSPTNKTAGPGRESYVQKQHETLASDVHLVEIDLLRSGEHVLAVPEHLVRTRWPYDYLVAVNRAERNRTRFEVYPRLLRQRLPRIRIPLAAGDSDVRLDLQAALQQVYDMGAYRDRIDYSQPCHPTLPKGDQDWASDLLAKVGQIST
jgi:hypothetical protein